MTGIRHRVLAALGLAGAFALGGCYDDGYGYGGVSVGTAYYGGGYADPYWDAGYYPGGYGWYGGYYYPGSGYYVYDRGGRRHRWNDGQRRYWEGRRGDRRPDGQWGRGPGANWQGRPGGDRDGQWQGRPGRGGDDRWQGRPGRGDQGNWQGRPGRPDRPGGDGAGVPARPTPGADGGRGFDAGRGGMRPPRQATPGMERPQRPSGGDRAMRQGGGDRRGPANRIRPN